MHTYACMYAHSCTHAYAHVCTHIHTHLCARIPTHTHNSKPALVLSPPWLKPRLHLRLDEGIKTQIHAFVLFRPKGTFCPSVSMGMNHYAVSSREGSYLTSPHPPKERAPRNPVPSALHVPLSERGRPLLWGSPRVVSLAMMVAGNTHTIPPALHPPSPV